MPLIQHPRARVMFCCPPVLPSCEEHLSIYLTIIPRARVGSESKAHKAKAEWANDSVPMGARELIVLVKSHWLVKNIETKHF